MYQNQLFFDDFQKVFKAKIVSEKSISAKLSTAVNRNLHLGFWLKRLLVKFNLQYRLN